MSHRANVHLTKNFDSVETAQAWFAKVKTLLTGKVEGKISTQISSSTRPEELTK